jgi:SAM-dependent methyltransferase
VDAQTLAYYQTAGYELAGRYEGVRSTVAQYFQVAFPARCRVLDVGAGSGRDLAELLAAGYKSYGVEPSAQLRRQRFSTTPNSQSGLSKLTAELGRAIWRRV